MHDANWPLIQELFESALQLSPADRDCLLAGSAAGPDDIVTVREMLHADAAGSTLLDHDIQSIASGLLATMPPLHTQPRDFGPYRLQRLLGEGGMGVVWLAERADTRSLVAIKFLPSARLSPARYERFMQEVHLQARLKHSSIACLYDAGTLADGAPWFAMEYIDGSTFTDFCRSLPSFEEVIQLFCSICAAVQYAHGKGVIHRDLKPSNILVDTSGTPKLLDFGIARELHQDDPSSGITALGLRFASPPYAAPEYMEDGTASAMSDVYSLGVILYGLLTDLAILPASRADFPDSRNSSSRKPDATSEEFKPSVPVRRYLTSSRIPDSTSNSPLARVTRSQWNDLDVVCLKAAHRDPDRRYPSVEALVRDLKHFLRQEPLEARPDSLSYRSALFFRRHTFAITVAVALFFLLSTMAVVFTVRLASARNAALAQARRADRVQQFTLGLFASNGRPADAPGKLSVEALVDRGARDAESLKQDPALQADLFAALGQMYADIGNRARSVTLYSKAFAIQETHPGIPIASRIDVRQNLAINLSEQYKWDQAGALVQNTLRFLAANAPTDRLHRLQANAEWGIVLGAKGKFKESEDFLKAAADGQETERAPKPDLVWTLISLSNTQFYLGHYADSDRTSKRLIALCNGLPAFTPQVSEAFENLGSTANTQGRYAEAEQYARQSVALAVGWYGEGHPAAITRQSTLASVLIDEKKYAEAGPLLDHIIANSKNAWPPNSHYFTKIWQPLGRLQLAEGHTEAAGKTFQKLLTLVRGGYPEDSSPVASAQLDLAMVYLQKKQYAKAEDLCRKALPTLLRSRGETDSYTALAHAQLGRALLYERRYDEAEQQLNGALATYGKLSLQHIHAMQDCQDDLAILRKVRMNAALPNT